MGLTGMRIYGHFTGVAPEAVEALENVCNFDVMDYADGVLDLEQEGGFFFADDCLDALLPHLEPEATGKLDVIDHDEWTMQRYEVAEGKVTAKDVNLNDVLERYNRQ